MASDIELITEMLTYRRPAGSRSERKYIRKFIDSVPGMLRDTFGNRYIVVGDASKVMWSSHTDTVHRHSGRQKIHLDGSHIKVYATDQSNCLGADCAAGNFIMLRMISAGVAGLYVFHRAEERGGLGSTSFAKYNPDKVLDGIDFCIAFDRKGTDSIVTEQFIGKCASDDAAWSLAHAMCLDMEPDPTGSFTDSATYAETEAIRECMNVSVGYRNEHTRAESLDTEWLFKLAHAMCNDFDASKLKCVRLHGDFGPVYSMFNEVWHQDKEYSWEDRVSTSEANHLADAIANDPHAIIELLETYGIDQAEVWEALQESGCVSAV